MRAATDAGNPLEAMVKHMLTRRYLHSMVIGQINLCFRTSPHGHLCGARSTLKPGGAKVVWGYAHSHIVGLKAAADSEPAIFATRRWPADCCRREPPGTLFGELSLLPGAKQFNSYPLHQTPAQVKVQNSRCAAGIMPTARFMEGVCYNCRKISTTYVHQRLLEGCVQSWSGAANLVPYQLGRISQGAFVFIFKNRFQRHWAPIAVERPPGPDVDQVFLAEMHGKLVIGSHFPPGYRLLDSSPKPPLLENQAAIAVESTLNQAFLRGCVQSLSAADVPARFSSADRPWGPIPGTTIPSKPSFD